jgi:hypothetical protein
MVVGGERHAPAALPQEETRYALYRMVGGSQDRSGRVRKISLPPDSIPGPTANIFKMILPNLRKELEAKAGRSRWHIELALTKTHRVGGQ